MIAPTTPANLIAGAQCLFHLIERRRAAHHRNARLVGSGDL
jgi:hypothetical protein